MFAQMETRHQEQMESMKEAMQAANERSMKMAEASIQEKQEAMVAVTPRQGAPTLEQPVLPPAWTLPERQPYIAPPVKPLVCEQMINVSGVTWHVCKHCK